MAVPHTNDNVIRIHDVAIFEWLEGLKFHYPEIENPLDAARIIAAKQNHPIIRVMASPSRAYASIIDTLIWQNWIPETDGQAMRDLASDNLAVLPLPACSIQRSDPRPDPELSNTAFVWQKGFFNCETQQWDYYRWPKTWLTDYTITFWGNNVYTKAFWLEWVMAQFGNIGAGISETFIPVEHAAPFGTINARLLYTGMEDLTELEGDEQRYTRSELTVTLRTWVTMPKLLNPPGVGGPCGTDEGNTEQENGGIGTPIYFLGLDYCINEQIENQVLHFYQTLNLWDGLLSDWLPQDFCRDWPTEGNGTISTEDKEVFEVSVSEETDRVQLFGVPVDMQDGIALIGFSFEYDTNAPMTLEVEQLDGTDENATVEPVYSTLLPQVIEGRYHQFFVVTQSIISAYLKGTGGTVKPQEITFQNPDLRIIGVLPRTIGSRTVGPSESRYEFTNLKATAYLVIFRFSGTPSGPYTVRLENDVAAPTHIVTQDVNSVVNSVGVILMNQPLTDSMVLVVDNNIVMTEVWAQPYEGYYNGHEA